MQALLLAAGLGTRLKPLTLSQPKCLIEINGIPMLKFWLDKLLNLDLDKIYINVYHFSEMVIKFIENNYPEENRIEILEEKNLKGTANTIKDLLSISKDSPTLILHSDNYSAIDLTKFINYFAIEPK